MKLKICFLGLLCAFFVVVAKGNKININDAGLKIGDVVPDVMLDNVLNYSSKTIRLSDFKGKLLILDFWATTCGSCIEAMPELESLQKEFGNHVQVLPVSGEKTLRVATFLKYNPTGKAMTLPVVAADTRLHSLFPHRIMSHEVWIGVDGKVLAITGPEYVNAKNIRQALTGILQLPVKMDVMAFDYTKPLLGSQQQPLYYSAVSNFKPGVARRFGVTLDSINGKVRTYAFNFRLLPMYLMAIEHLLYFPKSMMDIRVADSSRVFQPEEIYKGEWMERNSWCYESVLPAGITNARRMDAMRQDLNRFFGLNGRLEKRKTKCLSLERIETGLIPVSKGGVPKNTLHSESQEKVIVNDSLEDLIWEFNETPGGLPAVDNTGFKGNVDMILKVNSLKDIKAVNKALLPYGLILKEKIQELEFFVLTDAGI